MLWPKKRPRSGARPLLCPLSYFGRCFPLRCYVPVEFKFANEVTVRFAETDAQGVAHHAAYLVWFEVTRIEYLRRFRGGYAELRAEGVDALTLEAYARYVEAARFDDRLTIRARCGDVRGARFRFDYSIERDGVQVLSLIHI